MQKLDAISATVRIGVLKYYNDLLFEAGKITEQMHAAIGLQLARQQLDLLKHQ